LARGRPRGTRPPLVATRAMRRRARIIVVGAGSREHALGRALADGGHEVITAPGNPGTAALGRNAAVPVDDVAGLVALAVEQRPDLVVVGPELPLTLGLVDALAARGIAAFGPSRAAASASATPSPPPPSRSSTIRTPPSATPSPPGARWW
jgi:UDP-N-acetylmuramoylalanine-D-glutamate ligase